MLQLVITPAVKLTEENIELLFIPLRTKSVSAGLMFLLVDCAVMSEVYARHPRSEHVYALNCNQEQICSA